MEKDRVDEIPGSETGPLSAPDLLAECQWLLFELEQFRAYLAQHKKEQSVEVRTYRSRLRAELKALEKVRACQDFVESWWDDF